MKIVLGSDHGGYLLKDEIKKRLIESGHEVIDVGINSSEMVDYPIYAKKAVETMFLERADFTLLVCGTGIGMSIAANKIEGVRAALLSDCFSAEMAKAHNNANVITLGARTTGVELAWKIVESYIKAEFLGGIHEKRVEMLNNKEFWKI